MSKENEQKRAISIPKEPPMFCMLLRKHLEGAKIFEIKQPDYERILEFYFESYNEIGEKILLCLAVELMGKHSNIILYSYETNVILGAAHNICSVKSKEREIAGNLPYIYPAKRKKTDILHISFADFFNIVKSSSKPLSQTLSESFYNISNQVSKDICEILQLSNSTVLTKDKLESLYLEIVKVLEMKEFKPVIDATYDSFSIFATAKDGIAQNSVNDMIDNYFTHHQTEKLILHLKTKLDSKADKELKRLAQNVVNYESQAQKIDKALIYKHKADLIMGNLHSIDPHANKIKLFDYTANKNIEIDLDETLSATENANKYYKLYNKLKRTNVSALSRIEELMDEIKYYEQLKYFISVAKNVIDLEQIQQEIAPLNNKIQNIKDVKGAKGAFQINIETHAINGFEIFLGKNNKQNDYLLSKIAVPNDLWFHIKDYPGAHVILKNPQNRLIDDDTLLKAAEFTKKFSAGADAGKVSVIYTLKKFVKKIPQSKFGFVSYKGEKEIIV